MPLSPEMRAFLEERRFGVLATVNQDGQPQQSVMWFELRGDQIMINTNSTTLKLRNLERDPRYSIAIEDEYKYLTLRGTVDEIIHDQETTQADIYALAKRYNPELSTEELEEGWAYFKEQHRVTILFSIDHVVANGFGS